MLVGLRKAGQLKQNANVVCLIVALAVLFAKFVNCLYHSATQQCRLQIKLLHHYCAMNNCGST